MMISMANLTLIYGLRLLPEGEVTSIEGSREEIEAQLKQSLDAFFDFYPEI